MTRSITNTYFQRLSLLVGCAIGFSLTLGSPLTLLAQEPAHCKEWVGKVVSAEGLVEARRVSTNNWQPTTVGETFCPGDKLRVESWRAAIVLSNETIIRLDQGTTITFTEIENKETSWLEILEGIVHFISRVPQSLTITTPFVNATVEGTEFVIRVDSSETNVWVLEGTVRVENTLGKLLLEGGDAAVTRAGEGPQRRLDIHPRDAVQWALYYPPLLDVRTNAVTEANQESLQGALAQYQSGDIRGALDQLNTIPLERRDPQLSGIRAGLLLSVGQIDKANMDIKEALRQEPNNATALALQSVVSLVNNNKEEALQLANQSVESAPQSSVGYIARSYAQQSHFDIEAALTSAQQATTQSPDDALAWARVAELQLSLGHLGEAREAAQEAVRLNPNLARTQTILGFALLTEAKIANARKTFEQAIALDQADPLPRLGLGLTKIQKSELAEGRRDIEIAASLDPSNAIIRSYLGKAYFEEKWDRPLPKYPIEEMELADLHNNTRNNQRAASQLEMAKELDPRDPTPYFYDAIRKQSVNRPVEALEDLQKSIELNDNRAIYRSKLLLDDDKAARSASLGRIYKDLGFEQRARVEAWNSLSADPSNHSSHRLLADSLRSPRGEAARISELLQSQLFQPVNINNLQPQLSEASLQILEGSGPTAQGFNEFNPLYLRDRIALLGNLSVGNLDTIANDTVLSGMLADPIAISLGQFHYSTDGFRSNNDNTINLYNAFLQSEVIPEVNVQAEYRNRKVKQGDLSRNFDPSDFLNSSEQTTQEETARLGAKISPLSNIDLILSGIHSRLRATTNLDTTPSLKADIDDKAYQGEALLALRQDFFNILAGGRIRRINGNIRTEIGSFTVPFPPFIFPASISESPADIEHESAYIYTNTNFPNNVFWTGGLGYTRENIDRLNVDVRRILPKAGVLWNITAWARLRAAYFQTMKSSGIIEQTIEPTQIAGFNQLFIDANGTRSTNYGVGLDTIMSNSLYGGLEIFNREFSELAVVPGMGTRGFKYRTNLYRAYVYWAPHPNWATSTNFELERLYRPANVATGTFGDGRFTQLDTYILPINIRYFHSSGLFAGLRGTFLWQNLELPPNASFSDDSEGVFLLDLVAGFRFPKRLGILSIEIRNLTDQKFLYQDPNILRPEVGDQRFIPKMTGVIKLTIALN